MNTRTCRAYYSIQGTNLKKIAAIIETKKGRGILAKPYLCSIAKGESAIRKQI